MFIDFSKYKYYLKPGTTDLRRAINGLSLMIQNDMSLNIFSKSLFLFCKKQRKLLKIVYWYETGFCIWQKD